MSGRLRLSCFTVVFTLSGSFLAAAEPVDFAHDVVPLLKKHCVECHGKREAKGGFSLNTRKLLLESEAAIPGKSARSRLIELVTSSDADEQMPPKGKPRLTNKEVSVLRNWIDGGVKWEAGYTFGINDYEPPLAPRRPELPPIENGRRNPIDRIIDAYFVKKEIERPAQISDSRFLRRVTLDLIGLLPTPDQLARFQNDTRPDKRQQLVRELLGRIEVSGHPATDGVEPDIAFAEHWLSFWNDLLRNDYAGTGFITRGRKQISKWLYASLVSNKPYDQFVRELIAPPTPESVGFIEGIRWRGNVNASQGTEMQFAQNVGQALLGINLKCASCHDSFIDRWTMEETYALAQVYSNQQLTLHRCDKPINKQAKAGWLFPEIGQIDPKAAQPERLKQLAALVTHPSNGRFARTIVNRIWHRLMGRGIVHPVDAMHTRPWNADLLDYLAVHLADSKYDLKATIDLICSSEAYQSTTTSADADGDAVDYVYRGPLARRMTAEQFVDAVWQITGSAPNRFDAPVLRMKPVVDQADRPATPLQAKWIWSQADARAAKAGETVTFRRTFDLKSQPQTSVAALTCDNEYTLYVNGRKVAADPNWESVEVVSLASFLRAGSNEFLIVGRNAGNSANAAGLIFEARIQLADESHIVIATDDSWQWTSSKPDARGRFKKAPTNWQPAAAVTHASIWADRVNPRMTALLANAHSSNPGMVRAALLKADELMRALGRPNRDQIVTMRPDTLTTLEAINLANGQRLANSIVHGSQHLNTNHEAPAELAKHVFQFALSRHPSPAESVAVIELLGEQLNDQAVQDLLWSVFMLPEFQIVQ